MTINLKDRLRARLLGGRFRQVIQDDHSTISRLGNHHYINHHPGLIAPQYKPDFNAYEFSYYSQNGEDGLILFLLSKIGVAHHYVVEIGTGDARQCNSINLIRNFGWRGCLIEASESCSAKANDYFRQCRISDRIQLLQVTARPENIRDLFRQAGVSSQVDVLSIDIDSYDYWLWLAIDMISPRLVVIEYNASFGPVRSVTVPYANEWAPVSIYYHGASVTALARLGRQKAYVLAGCDSKGVNAFFIRADLAAAAGIAPVTPAQAFYPHFRRTRKLSVEAQYQAIAHLPLVKVEDN